MVIDGFTRSFELGVQLFSKIFWNSYELYVAQMNSFGNSSIKKAALHKSRFRNEMIDFKSKMWEKKQLDS